MWVWCGCGCGCGCMYRCEYNGTHSHSASSKTLSLPAAGFVLVLFAFQNNYGKDSMTPSGVLQNRAPRSGHTLSVCQTPALTGPQHDGGLAGHCGLLWLFKDQRWQVNSLEDVREHSNV